MSLIYRNTIQFTCTTINIIDKRVKEGQNGESSFLTLFIKDNRQKIVAKLLGQPVQVGSFPSQEK